MKAIINKVIKEETDEYMGVMEATVDLDNLNQKLYIAKDNIPDHLIGKTLDIDLCLYSDEYKTYRNQDEVESIVSKYKYDDNDNLDELPTCIVNGRITEASELEDNYYLKVMCKDTMLDLMLMKHDDARITIGDTISASCWTEMIVNSIIRKPREISLKSIYDIDRSIISVANELSEDTDHMLRKSVKLGLLYKDVEDNYHTTPKGRRIGFHDVTDDKIILSPEAIKYYIKHA